MFLKSPFARLWGLARALLLSIGALLVLVTLTPLVRWLFVPIAPRWTDVNRGVLVILSGETTAYQDPTPSLLIGQNTYWRAVRAIAVWRSGNFDKILICGAGTEETVKPLLLAAGVPKEAILIENQSRTTHEDAAFAKPILAGLQGPYVLVTSDYHMYRASHCFEKQGIPIETMPAPDVLKRYLSLGERWDCFRNLVVEFTAIAVYRARGWI